MILRLHIPPNPIFPSTTTTTTTTSSTKNPPFKPLFSAASAASTTTLPLPLPPDAGLLFRQKILYLQSLNVNSTKALFKNPNLRSTPLSTLQSIEHCLSSMGIERSALGRILDMNPALLTSDPYRDLYPIFDFLINVVQVPFHDIRKCIIRCPRLLICSVEQQLVPTLAFLQGLGFVGVNRISCQTTLLLVSSVEHTLVPKIEYLESLGFGGCEVREMVLRSPGLLTFSIENNYKPKMEFFLEEMNGDLVEIKKFPQYFSFSLERKIKPRHRLLVEHGFRISLSEMLRVSDGEFNARLIDMRLRTLDRRLQ